MHDLTSAEMVELTGLRDEADWSDNHRLRRARERVVRADLNPLRALAIVAIDEALVAEFEVQRQRAELARIKEDWKRAKTAKPIGQYHDGLRTLGDLIQALIEIDNEGNE